MKTRLGRPFRIERWRRGGTRAVKSGRGLEARESRKDKKAWKCRLKYICKASPRVPVSGEGGRSSGGMT